MERTGVLINKLKEQFEQGASPSQLMITLQLLQNELVAAQSSETTKYLGTSKVSVVMPRKVIMENRHGSDSPVVKAAELVAETVKKTIPVKEIPADHTSYTPPQKSQIDFVFDAPADVPTLAQGDIAKEINDLVSDKNTSLNDKLKQQKTELSEVLKDTPIKDLRKAIGINDRYVFINDLFRGDEAMYERSIKTINAFNIYPEAEYWMNRELKVKLGWDDTKETVVHFYQLVKRRFS